MGAFLHLFGKSAKHALDMMLSRDWQNEKLRKKMSKRLPKLLREKAEAIVADVRGHESDFRAAVAGNLRVVGYEPSPEKTAERFTIIDLEKGRFGPESAELVCNLGWVGEPGGRRWAEIRSETDWARFLKFEMVT